MPQILDPDFIHSVSRPFLMLRPVVAPKRRRWPSVLAASAMAVGLAALAVSGEDDAGLARAPPDAAIAPMASPAERPLCANETERPSQAADCKWL